MSRKIILGSNSPRRKQILAMAEIEFEVKASNAEEVVNPDLPLEQIPIDIAEQKAKPLLDNLKDDVLITADTIVVHQDKILGKPKDAQEAIAMIQRIQNDVHQVITGVCIQSAVKKECFSSSTKVYFNPLRPEQIEHYVSKYKPFDKAGSYAIQEWIGAIGIQKIEGCYYNVVGLPIQELVNRLSKL